MLFPWRGCRPLTGAPRGGGAERNAGAEWARDFSARVDPALAIGAANRDTGSVGSTGSGPRASATSSGVAYSP